VLDETRGDLPAAESMYRATLAIFDTAQAALKSEESQLPFVANAARIYDDYIQLLVREGKGDEAVAGCRPEPRAHTGARRGSGSAANLRPQRVSRSARDRTQDRRNAPLLLAGRKQSYLWVITPAKVALIPLPAQQEIRERIDRYSKTLNDVRDPLASRNQDAQALYQTLVAPRRPFCARMPL